MEQFLFGALKPKVDVRDYAVAAAGAEYPDSYHVEHMPSIKNQRSVSSCVAHATSTILEYFNKAETGEYNELSTDFIYGMQGVAYGRSLPGMYLRDACKIAKNYGDPLKTTIGGNTEQPQCTEKLQKALTDEVYAEAAISKIKSYAKCSTENAIKHALMNYGPVLACIKWYKSYTFDANKVIRFDTSTTSGYHAIVICGWDEHGWICQNSWGEHWNRTGRFKYPFKSKLEEAWSFVDADNEDILKPKRNKILDVIYSVFNFIANIFKRKK